MTVYINAKNPDGSRETIDEFATRKEAVEAIGNYREAFRGSGIALWLSCRCCRDWGG